jgi:hypothetical protein
MLSLMHDNYERGIYEYEEYQCWQKVNSLKEKLELLNRSPEVVIDRAARTLLNLNDICEWATREECKMLVRTMVQEVGSDVGTKRIFWVKANPDYKILFRLMDGLRPNVRRRFWIRGNGAEVDFGDIEEEIGQIGSEVEIRLPMFHNALTTVRSV